MQAAKIAVPQFPIAEMLIDTGASHTSIDKTILAQLGLSPTGVMPVHTPSTGDTPVNMATYDVGLLIAGGVASAQHVIPTHSVTECDFSKQGIGGLIGRDILANARLTYSGPDSFLYLSF